MEHRDPRVGATGAPYDNFSVSPVDGISNFEFVKVPDRTFEHSYVTVVTAA